MARTRFRNPANGYEEEFRLAWLWCLLFGFIYFAVRGVWTHAAASLVLAIVTGGLAWLIYPFFATQIVEKHYLRKGWVPIAPPNIPHPPISNARWLMRFVVVTLLAVSVFYYISARNRRLAYSPATSISGATSTVPSNAPIPTQNAPQQQTIDLADLKKTNPQAYLEAQTRADKDKERDQIDHPARYVTIEKFRGTKDGATLKIEFSIKNDLPWTIKDVTIQCKHSAPSGTTIDQNTRTIYEKIEPKKTKRITGFNMGFIHAQATSTGCDVIDIVVVR